VRLPVYRGKGGLAPGLTGRSNKAMLDVADEAPDRWRPMSTYWSPPRAATIRITAPRAPGSKHVTSFDSDLKRLLPRGQFTLLPV
jgi:hypothetical protein